mmetsp:Transcript_586/g.819  ORF Transcript_586/g.819 Transcript_586/m.819 type:complete len:202 (-) Transcript_586:359-964(-)
MTPFSISARDARGIDFLISLFGAGTRGVFKICLLLATSSKSPKSPSSGSSSYFAKSSKAPELVLWLAETGGVMDFGRSVFIPDSLLLVCSSLFVGITIGRGSAKGRFPSLFFIFETDTGSSADGDDRSSPLLSNEFLSLFVTTPGAAVAATVVPFALLLVEKLLVLELKPTLIAPAALGEKASDGEFRLTTNGSSGIFPPF